MAVLVSLVGLLMVKVSEYVAGHNSAHYTSVKAASGGTGGTYVTWIYNAKVVPSYLFFPLVGYLIVNAAISVAGGNVKSRVMIGKVKHPLNLVVSAAVGISCGLKSADRGFGYTMLTCLLNMAVIGVGLEFTFRASSESDQGVREAFKLSHAYNAGLYATGRIATLAIARDGVQGFKSGSNLLLVVIATTYLSNALNARLACSNPSIPSSKGEAKRGANVR